MSIRIKSEVQSLSEVFAESYSVDFYQREYVWRFRQVEDLIHDLVNEFLSQWNADSDIVRIYDYSPYYVGGIVVSSKDNHKVIIDGQQRFTTFTLLLICLWRNYRGLERFPQDIYSLICEANPSGLRFRLDVEERRRCMESILRDGMYSPQKGDTLSVSNIIDRYTDIEDSLPQYIQEKDIVPFSYWLKQKVVFSKIETNNDEFAYIIFETMNDRGLSLTQVEMLRSFLLANVTPDCRARAMSLYDDSVKRLMAITLSSKSKAEFEFFKMYLRGHYAESFSQTKDSTSDFVRIGKEFHRWVRDNHDKLGLKSAQSFLHFIEEIDYFSRVYEKIYNILYRRDTANYLYLIVNGDYGFTLQPALIMAAISYGDSDDVVDKKIYVVARYLTKMLSWRVWNQSSISQSYLEAPIYEKLCPQVKDKSYIEQKRFFDSQPFDELQSAPQLNQQNNRRFKVLLALITEVVARECGESGYICKPDIEIEHIWANHFEQHRDEFANEQEFSAVRNTVGDLLLLPKSFNASYGDAAYNDKVRHYLKQNILAQSLSVGKYENEPKFLSFIKRSGLPFKPYSVFNKQAIAERTELYKKILEWHFDSSKGVC